MISRCKRVDITDLDFIIAAVRDCIAPKRKRERGDTIRLVKFALKCSRKAAASALRERGESFERAVRVIAAQVQRNILSGDLRLPKVRQKVKYDHCSRKERVITVLDIYHFLYEYVAVYGLQDLFKRVGEYQVSSIKGRGMEYGRRAICRWLDTSRRRLYYAKLDIRDFYGSVDRGMLMEWLSGKVRNKPLVGLVRRLVHCTDRGLAIGSFLSQTLANLYLSDIYHFAKERTDGVVAHALFYMDDMLLIGRDRRRLRRTVDRVCRLAASMGLQVKPNWSVRIPTRENPIDMLGYRMSKGRCSVRKRVFLRMRRASLRAVRLLRKGARVPAVLARRVAAYHGFASHSCIGVAITCAPGYHTFKEIFKYAREKCTICGKACAVQG